MEKVNVIGLTFNMKMNTKKTKAMVIGRAIIKPVLKITPGNAEVEQVKKFVYFGQ